MTILEKKISAQKGVTVDKPRMERREWEKNRQEVKLLDTRVTHRVTTLCNFGLNFAA